MKPIAVMTSCPSLGPLNVGRKSPCLKYLERGLAGNRYTNELLCVSEEEPVEEKHHEDVLLRADGDVDVSESGKGRDCHRYYEGGDGITAMVEEHSEHRAVPGLPRLLPIGYIQELEIFKMELLVWLRPT